MSFWLRKNVSVCFWLTNVWTHGVSALLQLWAQWGPCWFKWQVIFVKWADWLLLRGHSPPGLFSVVPSWQFTWTLTSWTLNFSLKLSLRWVSTSVFLNLSLHAIVAIRRKPALFCFGQDSSGSCAVDVSSVWWGAAGYRELCVVTACESSVSLWKPQAPDHWEKVYTWQLGEVWAQSLFLELKTAFLYHCVNSKETRSLKSWVQDLFFRWCFSLHQATEWHTLVMRKGSVLYGSMLSAGTWHFSYWMVAALCSSF